MKYNFIFDDDNTSMGFLEKVESVDIDVNRKTIKEMGDGLNYYVMWSGSGNNIDKSKVELINQGKMKLLLISDGEALQEMTLDWAMDVIKDFKINSTQVIFMSYDLRSDETYKLLLKEFSKFRKYPLSVIGMDTYCFESHTNYGDLPLPTKKKKPYKYVCYNANAKEYRMFMVTELFRRGLDKQGLISLLFRYGSPEQMSSDFVYDLGFDVKKGYGKLVDEYAKKEMTKRVPLILDQTMEEVDKNDRPVGIDHVKNSYFNIITESYMYNNSLPQSHKTIFEMSEKTYKALICQPFIHLGSYGVLKYMRSMGYQTFSELFDESYDDIINHKERLVAVINSVEKVCQMEDDEFHNIYCNEIVPKVIHNRKLAKSKKIKEQIWNKFVTELVKL
jgi:3-methyladenine DNA glycosylase Tag|tara:strand:- start:385 stop:1554 length:1170 start_codon:yes stop_codon:yes gene_type:complete